MYLIILHELDAAELFVNPDHIVKCHLNTEELELCFLVARDTVRISVCRATELKRSMTEPEAVDSTGLHAYRLDVTSKNY